MKTNQTPDNDPLHTVLREWRVDSALPPRFQEQVWDRIAQGEAHPQAGPWTALWRWLGDVLPRPRVAVAYLSIFLVLGAAAGSVASQAKASRMEAELSQRYVQSIDPYQADRSTP
jgi:hypothetical protein